MIACPHCTAANADDATFCASCGKTVSAGSSGPRIVTEMKGMANSSTGRKLQIEEVQKKIKGVFITLLAVGILTIVLGVILKVRLDESPAPEIKKLGMTLLVINLVLGAIYISLAFWSKKKPLPAAIIGLCLFVGIHAVNAIQDPATIPQGLLIKIVIISVLVRAIVGALQCRKLERAMAAEND